jgi:hypothetical protein
MLSDNERRRFEQMASELGKDDNLVRLDRKSRRRAKKASASRPRRRSLTEWAEQRFYDRLRRARGWP